jgi:hypothetical protein
MSGGGVVVNSAPKMPLLMQGILAVCEQNMGTHQDVNFLDQIGDHVKNYWVGNIITGPTGTVTVTSTGQWVGPKVVQNFDFNIMLNMMIAAFRIHLLTLTGTYVSSVVPGVTTPWSGGTFQALS